MNPSDLKNWIESLTDDIEFVYRGVSGSICPFSRNDISVSYGEDEKTFHSVSAVMDTPFIGGMPLKAICQDFEF